MASAKKGFHVAIEIDQPEGSYYPGDEVSGNILIESEVGLDTREVIAGLVYVQHFQVRVRSSQNPVVRWETDERWVDKEVLNVDRIPSGYKQATPFKWRIPPDALPPCSGRVVRNRWSVLVKVDRPMAPDVVSEAEIPVIVPPPGMMEGGEFTNQQGPVPAYMSFNLPRLAFAEREILSGELVVSAHVRAVEVRGVRVELLRRERVTAEDGKVRTATEQKTQLSASTTFKPGAPETFEFRLPVATRGCPSLVATNSEVSWFLRGVLDRPNAKDVMIQQEVYLFNGLPRV